MVAQLGRHGGFDLTVTAAGDLEVDAHHTVEDVGIILGEALAEALGDKAGVRRFASIALPLDEALVEVALDLSGRPYLVYDVDSRRTSRPARDPPFDPQLAEEFWRAFVTAAGDHPAPPAAHGQEHPPHPRGVVQGGGPGPARRRPRARAAAFPPPRARCARPVIAVLDYGIGNLRSAEKALQHLGADARLVDDPDRGRGGRRRGAARGGRLRPLRPGPARRAGWTRWPVDAVERGVPFLGICVGFQLLYEGSDEDPGAAGLGVLRRHGPAGCPTGSSARRCSGTVLERPAGAGGGPAGRPARHRPGSYFVHSYAPERTATTWSATCDYGGPVAAAAERGPVWGTQFHPEKSGAGRAWASWPTSCARRRRTPRPRDGPLPGHRPPRRRAVRLVQGDFDRQTRLRRPGGAGPPLRRRRRPLAPRRRPRRGPRPASRSTGRRSLAIAAAVDVPVQAGGACAPRTTSTSCSPAGSPGWSSAPRPSTTRRWLAALAGACPGRVAVGLDYRRDADGRAEVAVRGWEQRERRARVDELLDELAGADLAAVIVTAIDRDGTLAGPDLDGLRRGAGRHRAPGHRLGGRRPRLADHRGAGRPGGRRPAASPGGAGAASAGRGDHRPGPGRRPDDRRRRGWPRAHASG